MKIGLQLNHYNTPGGAAQMADKLANAAILVDYVGFDSLWVLDHFFQMEGAGPIDEPMLEAYTTLGYLAGLTQSINLGVMVTGVVYRHPAVLVKTVSTLDVLSAGRAVLGIGAAWYEREARGLGLPFPPLAVRFEWLEETLQIAHVMWKDERAPYHGRHFRLDEPLDRPRPIRQPHPPILVGGMGEQKTLRLVAQYADACNFDFPIGADMLTHKLDVLRAHCEAVGRDFASIEKTTHGPADGQSTQELIDLAASLRGLGFDHIIFNLRDVYDPAVLDRLADAAPGIKAL